MSTAVATDPASRTSNNLLRCLLAELDLTLALSGYTTISELDPSALRD